MKKITITVIIILVVVIASIAVYIYSGAYNVSQLVEHNSLTKWVITTAKDNSISKRIKDLKVPPMNDTAMFTVGFVHYNEMCATCHGGPGISPDELAKGLNPTPPKFYKSNDMPEPAEAFWIIKNGIKFTAMPAFGPTHNDQKIWAITDFLLNKMNKMSPEEYQEWKKKYSTMD
ncbi:MAG: cytochrome c [Ginsengibacter sp.]|jgi:mono/diheme cytochrome c family protein